MKISNVLHHARLKAKAVPPRQASCCRLLCTGSGKKTPLLPREERPFYSEKITIIKKDKEISSVKHTAH